MDMVSFDADCVVVRIEPLLAIVLHDVLHKHVLFSFVRANRVCSLMQHGLLRLRCSVFQHLKVIRSLRLLQDVVTAHGQVDCARVVRSADALFLSLLRGRVVLDLTVLDAAVHGEP